MLIKQNSLNHYTIILITPSLRVRVKASLAEDLTEDLIEDLAFIKGELQAVRAKAASSITELCTEIDQVKLTVKDL